MTDLFTLKQQKLALNIECKKYNILIKELKEKQKLITKQIELLIKEQKTSTLIDRELYHKLNKKSKELNIPFHNFISNIVNDFCKNKDNNFLLQNYDKIIDNRIKDKVMIVMNIDFNNKQRLKQFAKAHNIIGVIVILFFGYLFAEYAERFF